MNKHLDTIRIHRCNGVWHGHLGYCTDGVHSREDTPGCADVYDVLQLVGLIIDGRTDAVAVAYRQATENGETVGTAHEIG